MNQALEIAGIGLAMQQKALDILANNIANINTPAFRRSDVRFSEIVTARADAANPTATQTPSVALAGVRADAALALDEQGELERTGRPLDLAVSGAGFIEVMGPRGQILLWRGGTLAIAEDGLLSAGGMPLRAMIEPPADTTALSISPDGIVRAQRAGSDDALELGRITVVRVDDTRAIERLDGGFYRVVDDRALTESTPGEDGAGQLVQGAIERSNVSINAEMVRLLVIQRAYAANAQLVQAADNFMAIANNLRR